MKVARKRIALDLVQPLSLVVGDYLALKKRVCAVAGAEEKEGETVKATAAGHCLVLIPL